MKTGAESRKKTIAAGGLGALALCCVVYGYNALFGGSPPPVPAPAPRIAVRTGGGTGRVSGGPATGGFSNGGNGLGTAGIAGVNAEKIASTSSSLDPTLDESAMLRTESLVYSGIGRNIFAARSVAPVVALPKNVPSARPGRPVYVPPPAPAGPPPPPPINLKFFGTESRVNGERQVFLLQGENVYLAAQGDIVARKYKIVSISASSIQVRDMVNNNTQTLPLQR